MDYFKQKMRENEEELAYMIRFMRRNGVEATSNQDQRAFLGCMLDSYFYEIMKPLINCLEVRNEEAAVHYPEVNDDNENDDNYNEESDGKLEVPSQLQTNDVAAQVKEDGLNDKDKSQSDLKSDTFPQKRSASKLSSDEGTYKQLKTDHKKDEKGNDEGEGKFDEEGEDEEDAVPDDYDEEENEEDGGKEDNDEEDEA